LRAHKRLHAYAPISNAIHDDINLFWFVIPGLTRNPVFSWIPAFTGMTTLVGIKVAVYNQARRSPGYRGLYENFWPPMLASYIRPPLATVNTAIPLV
jgi:hypothetical protein